MFFSTHKKTPQEDYQEFLVSPEREHFVEDSLYKQLIPALQDQGTILDFGCGLGYVSLLYAREIKEKNIDAHVYACDWQEEFLDMLWKRIVDYKLNRLTPFFVANKARAIFPNWIPAINHVIFSFSFSSLDGGLETAENILQEIRAVLAEGAKIHIVEWNPLYQNPRLEKVFSPNMRIEQATLIKLLEKFSFTIEKRHKVSNKRYAHLSEPAIYAFTCS